MTSTTPVRPFPPGESGPGTAPIANIASIRSLGLWTKEFLPPTLVSIGIEIGTVAFLISLLLLVNFLRPGDGGDLGGGSGNGKSGQGGTGEFSAVGSGSGTGEDETETIADSKEPSRPITEVNEAPAASGSQAQSAVSLQKSGNPLSPPEEEPTVFIVQDLPQPVADTEPEGLGGGSGFSDVGDRLRQAGAKTGDVQISLAWNNGNDLDLHVETPGGEKIWYNHRNSTCGGELDVDMNAGGPASQRPVENIYWPSGESPSGAFRVMVHHYANHGGRDPTRFQVTIKVKDKTQSFSGSLRFGDASRLVQEFTFP